MFIVSLVTSLENKERRLKRCLKLKSIRPQSFILVGRVQNSSFISPIVDKYMRALTHANTNTTLVHIVHLSSVVQAFGNQFCNGSEPRCKRRLADCFIACTSICLVHVPSISLCRLRKRVSRCQLILDVKLGVEGEAEDRENAAAAYFFSHLKNKKTGRGRKYCASKASHPSYECLLLCG